MISLTITVANVAQVLAAGWDQVRILKSADQTATGAYAPQTPVITLQDDVTSYPWVDVDGAWANWYRTEFYKSDSGTRSRASAPQPGYLSDLCDNIRDLLGVDAGKITDAQIQQFAFLPTALSTIRGDIANFDTRIAAEDDVANLLLGALATYTAALLCPRMQILVPTSESMGQYRYQLASTDWAATAQSLMDRYHLLISQALDALAGDITPEMGADWVTPIIMSGPTRTGAEDTSGGLVSLPPAPALDE